MGVRQTTQTPADREAAEWHARLGTRTISLDTVQEFHSWRQAPANDAAYRRIEGQWDEADKLAEDPEILAALKAAQQRGPKRRRRRKATAAAVAIGAACALALGGVFFWQQRGVYATNVGETRVITLADGSTVRLDTGSRLRVRLSGHQRRIELETGQAWFEVAHDPARPFIVFTDDAAITAVGTVFEVRRTAAETRVVLVEGLVDVRAPDAPAKAPRRMAPNQEATVSRGATRLEPVNAKASTSWTEGKLTFQDTPLKEAVAEVNRYLAHPIVLDAPSAANTPVNGVFRSGDRAAFVAATTDLLGLEASPEADGRVHLIGPRR